MKYLCESSSPYLIDKCLQILIRDTALMAEFEGFARSFVNPSVHVPDGHFLDLGSLIDWS